MASQPQEDIDLDHVVLERKVKLRKKHEKEDEPDDSEATAVYTSSSEESEPDPDMSDYDEVLTTVYQVQRNITALARKLEALNDSYTHLTNVARRQGLRLLSLQEETREWKAKALKLKARHAKCREARKRKREQSNTRESEAPACERESESSSKTEKKAKRVVKSKGMFPLKPW
jgi:hypothetical protein